MNSRTLLGLPLMFTLAAAACGGAPAPAPQGQEQPKPGATAPAAVDPATAASIKGKITFDGTAPANAPSSP